MPPHPQHHHHSHCHSSSPSPSPFCSFSTPSPSPSPPPSCCSCCCGCCPSPQSPQSPPPDQMVVLLQSLLSNQLHISNPPPSDHHLLQTLANHHLKPYPQPPQRQHKDPDSKTQSLLLSLLRRVSTLESQLPDLSRPLTPPPPPPPVVPASAAPKPSLRDVAARTIQARFREFLVRRSRTLRHLKQLAALKSHAAALRSSLSGKVRVADSERVSQRAMDLLLQLDSIQSSDLMIREGKKSITRELTRILEFVDKVSPNSIKEDGAGTDRRRRHCQNSKGVKRVSFSEFDSYAPFAEDLIDLSGEMARLDEEHAEDAEVEVENGVRYGIGRRKLEVHNGNLGLYAPMPVHMEPKES